MLTLTLPSPPAPSPTHSWAALEELVHEGTVRAIGVSNFNVPQLQALLSVAKIKPALVQSNSDPLHQVGAGSAAGTAAELAVVGVWEGI